MKSPNFQIIIDTREQNPLQFPSREITTVNETLDTGDYSIRIDGQLLPVRIERKSIGDLFGSFSGQAYQREKEKIKRANDANCRYILAVEGSSSVVRKGHRYYAGGKWHESGKDGLTQVRQIETISMKYGVELRYCEGRRDMGFQVQEILLAYVRAWEREARRPSGLAPKNSNKEGS